MSRRAYRAFLIAVILVELWLVQGFPLTAHGGPYDQALFVRQAVHLSNGDWLGPYDLLTLAKGMFYPLFIAIGFKLCIPLVTWQHMLHLASCLVLVLALGDICRKHWQKALLFAVLAFNPIVFCDMTSTFRARIYSPLSLLVMACLIGACTRRRAGLRQFLAWSAGLGLSLSAFWLTREEGVWMLPACGAFAAYAAWDVLRRRPADRLIRWVACALPFIILGLSVGVVSTLNYRYYGVFMTNEFKSKAFRAAYGSLLRVKHAKPMHYVPVPVETRERIYAVSPLFARLRPWLTGDNAKKWGKYSVPFIGREAYEADEIGGGHFVWAFRAAVDEIGCSHSAMQSQEFYRNLAEEVNGACERGEIECGARRDSLSPPWRSGDEWPLLKTFGRGLAKGVWLPWEWTINPYSTAPPKYQHPAYRQVVWMETAPAKEDALTWENQRPGKANMLRRKTRIIHGVTRIYMWAATAAAVAALAWYPAMLLRAVKSRKAPAVFRVCSILLFAYACRIAMLSYVDFMATGVALDFRRLSATYSFVLVFSAMGMLDAYNTMGPSIRRRLKGGASESRVEPNDKGSA